MQILSYDASVPNQISNSSKKSSTLYKARLLSIFGDKIGAFCMEFGKLFIYSRARVLVNHRPMSRRFSASGFVSVGLSNTFKGFCLQNVEAGKFAIE